MLSSRDHRGLDGDQQARDDRRRTPRGGRSAAEDDGSETFLAREEWAGRPGEESRAAVVAARRSRHSRSWARSSQKEARCSCVRNSFFGRTRGEPRSLNIRVRRVQGEECPALRNNGRRSTGASCTLTIAAVVRVRYDGENGDGLVRSKHQCRNSADWSDRIYTIAHVCGEADVGYMSARPRRRAMVKRVECRINQPAALAMSRIFDCAQRAPGRLSDQPWPEQHDNRLRLRAVAKLWSGPWFPNLADFDADDSCCTKSN